MTLYMLDTNTVSYLVKGRLDKERRFKVNRIADFCISAITEGELLFGVMRRPGADRLEQLIRQFLARVETLPFDSETAGRFALLRVEMQKTGKSVDSFDMLIAAHALSVDATLVTSDKAFSHVPGLRTENWA